MTTRRPFKNDPRRRGATILGVAVALVALGVQFAAATLHLPLAAAAAGQDVELARLLDEHALCLAGNADRPVSPAPTDKGPPPARHHLGLCCPWHANASPILPRPTAIGPVAFAVRPIGFATIDAIVVASRPPGTARARAPPLDA